MHIALRWTMEIVIADVKSRYRGSGCIRWQLQWACVKRISGREAYFWHGQQVVQAEAKFLPALIRIRLVHIPQDFGILGMPTDSLLALVEDLCYG